MALALVGTPEWWLDRLGRRLTERAGRATFTRVGRDDVGVERRLVVPSTPTRKAGLHRALH